VQDLWLFDTALFVVLGVLQGAALGLALSLAIEPDAPALDSAFRVRTWRAALGKAVVTLPLPAALAVLLTFYEDNRDRFSSVGVGGFLTLALSPAPAGGSQQSAPAGDGGGGGGLLYSTYTYVDRAQQSLNGELRRRDFAFIEAMALRLLASNEVFEQLNKRARTALIQVGAGGSYEDRTRAPNCEAPRQDGPAEPAPALGARKQADPAAGSDAPASGASRDDPPPVRQQMAYASPAPGVPPAGAAADPSEADSHGWGADRTKRRILDLHAPYRAIGTANFYAAIGSFETAYLVLRDWLALDIALRRSAPALDEALPRWFRVRVLQEAAEMYRNTSSEARLSERFRRQLDEVVREYRRVVPGPLRSAGLGRRGAPGPRPARPGTP
jgi:hypothetical protein